MVKKVPVGVRTNSMHFKLKILLFGLISILAYACKTDSPTSNATKEEEVEIIRIPAFSGDSAYAYVAKQVEFGPRVPGTDEHKACRDWLKNKFESFGAEVILQDFIANIYTGDRWESSNIIAQFNPDAKERVMLSAHWDSRMMAEEDRDKSKRDNPILGADDGASGVGVLVEVARLIQANPLTLGVDIILFDAEDQGKRGMNSPIENWCLGAQHWSRNPHRGNYKAKYGILLDMVGSKNPRFGKDNVSRQYAGKIQQKLWKMAQNMGYSNMFVDDDTGAITDDHYFVNVIAGIPMVDIINQPVNSKTGFGSYWHTHDDDMDVIDKRSLQVVGQVVTAAVYKTNNKQF